MIKNKKKAFTLIELLVVIAIIGILATLAVIALQQARSRARDSKRVADMKQVQTALELFFNENSRYPTVDEWNSGSIVSSSSGETFMYSIPLAPSPADGECLEASNTYQYIQTESGSSYEISFCTGKQIADLTEGVKCLTPGGIINNCNSTPVDGGEEGGEVVLDNCLTNPENCGFTFVTELKNGLELAYGIGEIDYFDLRYDFATFNNNIYLSAQVYDEELFFTETVVLEYKNNNWTEIFREIGENSYLIEIQDSLYLLYGGIDEYNWNISFYLKKYNGSSWQDVGSYLEMSTDDYMMGCSLYSEPYYYNNSFYSIIGCNGMDMITFEDIYDFFLIKNTDGSWTSDFLLRADPYNPGGFNSTFDISVYEGDVYQVYTFLDTDDKVKANFRKYNGSSWTDIGNAGSVHINQNVSKNLEIKELISNAHGHYVQIAEDRTYPSTSQNIIKEYNGSSWNQLGSSLPIGNQTRYILYVLGENIYSLLSNHYYQSTNYHCIVELKQIINSDWSVISTHEINQPSGFNITDYYNPVFLSDNGFYVAFKYYDQDIYPLYKLEKIE